MDIKELLKLSPAELVDLGVCPTCLNRKYNKAIYLVKKLTRYIFYPSITSSSIIIENPVIIPAVAVYGCSDLFC